MGDVTITNRTRGSKRSVSQEINSAERQLMQSMLGLGVYTYYNVPSRGSVNGF